MEESVDVLICSISMLFESAIETDADINQINDLIITKIEKWKEKSNIHWLNGVDVLGHFGSGSYLRCPTYFGYKIKNSYRVFKLGRNFNHYERATFLNLDSVSVQVPYAT